MDAQLDEILNELDVEEVKDDVPDFNPESGNYEILGEGVGEDIGEDISEDKIDWSNALFSAGKAAAGLAIDKGQEAYKEKQRSDAEKKATAEAVAKAAEIINLDIAAVDASANATRLDSLAVRSAIGKDKKKAVADRAAADLAANASRRAQQKADKAGMNLPDLAVQKRKDAADSLLDRLTDEALKAPQNEFAQAKVTAAQSLVSRLTGTAGGTAGGLFTPTSDSGSFWDQYWKWILGGVGALAAVSGFVWWRRSR